MYPGWRWLIRALIVISVLAGLSSCGGAEGPGATMLVHGAPGAPVEPDVPVPPAEPVVPVQPVEPVPAPGNPADAQALSDLSGIYVSSRGNVVIDPSGMVVGAYVHVPLEVTPAERLLFLAFSGRVTASGRQWRGQALEIGESSSATGAVLATSTTTATLEGTFSRDGTISFKLSGPGLSPRVSQAIIVVPARLDVTETASLQAIGGNYMAQLGASIPEAGTPTFLPDTSIDPVTGDIRAMFAPNCTFAGAVQVQARSRNIYRVSGTMAGSGCTARPGKVYELLAYKSRQGSVTLLDMWGNIDGQIGHYGFARY